MKSKLSLFIDSLVLIISFLLLWRGYAPNPREVRIQNISPTEMRLNEERRLTFEFPTQIHAAGEGELVRLRLDTVTGGAIQSPDLYDTHNVTAEAEFDMPGVDIQPAGVTFEPLKRGQPATFVWNVRPGKAGTYPGTVWLHLDFENRSTGEKDRVAISAQVIEIEAVSFFGMSFNVARVAGIIGLLAGSVLFFPFLRETINKQAHKK